MDILLVAINHIGDVSEVEGGHNALCLDLGQVAEFAYRLMLECCDAPRVIRGVEDGGIGVACPHTIVIRRLGHKACDVVGVLIVV